MNTGGRKNTGSNKNHNMVTTISDEATVFLPRRKFSSWCFSPWLYLIDGLNIVDLAYMCYSYANGGVEIAGKGIYRNPL